MAWCARATPPLHSQPLLWIARQLHGHLPTDFGIVGDLEDRHSGTKPQATFFLGQNRFIGSAFNQDWNSPTSFRSDRVEGIADHSTHVWVALGRLVIL